MGIPSDDNDSEQLSLKSNKSRSVSREEAKVEELKRERERAQGRGDEPERDKILASEMLLNDRDKLDFDLDLNRFDTCEKTNIDFNRTQEWQHVQRTNNIKMIKLYSWQENFLERIFRRRERDVAALRLGGASVALLISCVYLFPSLLPATTFAVYIAFGNTLQYQVAVASLVLFNLMRGPLIQAPIFFGDLVQLFVSMRRI